MCALSTTPSSKTGENLEKIFQYFLISLDHARGAILQKTLHFSWAQKLFTLRANRHLLFFLLAVLIYLPLSLFFPIWIAILGPIMYGLPHIVSSLRYSAVPSLTHKARAYFVGLWLLVMTLRILTDTQVLELETYFSFDLEILAMTLAMLGFAFFAKPFTLKILTAGSLLAGALVYMAWNFPFELTAFLLIAHNFIAFFYWLGHAATRKDRQVAGFCLVTFSLLTALIISGRLDFVYRNWSPNVFVDWAKMGYSDLGKSLAPWSADYKVWFRLFVAYVFGQSLHYFIWLKAIPEQQKNQQTPVSFRLSFHLLQKSFGKNLWLFLVSVCLGSLGIWFFFEMQEARLIYFAIASYHGFHEFAGLPFFINQPSLSNGVKA